MPGEKNPREGTRGTQGREDSEGVARAGLGGGVQGGCQWKEGASGERVHAKRVQGERGQKGVQGRQDAVQMPGQGGSSERRIQGRENSGRVLGDGGPSEG